MITNEREILMYYNEGSRSDRMTLAYARSIVIHIKSYTFDKAPSTTTSWQQILKALAIHPKDLLDKAHPYYQKNIRGRDFDDEDWLNVLKYNPELIKAPIALRGDRAIFCLTPTDIYRLV